jgi:hypothetical protein
MTLDAMQARYWANMRERIKRKVEPQFYCSRVKLGPNRVFYAVWRCSKYFDEDRKPLECGYTTTVEEAERQMAEITASCPEPGIIRDAQHARRYHGQLAEEKRRRRPPSGERQSAGVEFVYRDYWFSDEPHAEPYRIIRRTRQRVFINVNPWWDDQAGDLWDGRTHALNREELEQAGSTSIGNGWGKKTFYVSNEAYHREHRRSSYSELADCLAFFGLKLPTNIDALRAVYRDRVKRTHPDLGGSAGISGGCSSTMRLPSPCWNASNDSPRRNHDQSENDQPTLNPDGASVKRCEIIYAPAARPSRKAKALRTETCGTGYRRQIGC